MEAKGTITDCQQGMHYSSATLMGTSLPYTCTNTGTDINTIILNSQIPGAQRLAVHDSATSPTLTLAPTGVAQTQLPTTPTPIQGHTGIAQTQLPITPTPTQAHTGVTQTQLHITPTQLQAHAGIAQTQLPITPTPIQAHIGVAQTQLPVIATPTQIYSSVVQTQLPVINTSASLRLPSIVAVEGGIKPDISLCSKVLKSFSDQDQASSDLEVQSVMFPETRGLLPTVKRICQSRSSSSGKSSKSSYSPMRQPTTLTNAKRGNVQTTTPTFIPEYMSIHQLAAQGELSLLIERLENFQIERVDKPDVQGYTPLIWACAHDQIDTAELLLRFGADPSRVSLEGECALSFACSNGNLEIVRMLLRENVDINNYNWSGGTPLLYSVYSNHSKCCELLLRSGADMTVETDRGQTALSLAISLGHHKGNPLLRWYKYVSCHLRVHVLMGMSTMQEKIDWQGLRRAMLPFYELALLINGIISTLTENLNTKGAIVHGRSWFE